MSREEIIYQAITEKLVAGSTFNFFTADDVLEAAGIEESQLEEVQARISSIAASAPAYQAKDKEKPKAARKKPSRKGANT